jgi:hypothetical protein
MSKHTPGPWTFGDESNAGCEVMAGPVAIVLDRFARVRDDGSFVISRDEMLSNANLIAAAPDLLSALEAVGEAFDGFYDVGPHEAFVFSEQTMLAVNEAFTKARSAIKKARG